MKPADMIKIAANSIDELRKSDVYRGLDTHFDDTDKLASYIISNRPDLKDEVLGCLEELAE